MNNRKKKNSGQKTRIAVVGGGIFGITIAVRLANQGHRVDLFEKESGILRAASGINQFRLHRGYHYPRSTETTIESIRTEIGFRHEYGAAVVDSGHQYYCISKRDSLISANAYASFCKRFGLECEVTQPKLFNHGNIDLCVRVPERRIDPKILERVCMRRLKQSGVNVYLNTTANSDIMKKYDFTAICTYANINGMLSGHSDKMKEYQFELCEKPVVKMPHKFSGKGMVIMDGPFMCVDPLGETGTFLLGNVVHAIHQTNIGKFPELKKEFKPLLNKGVVKNPSITNFSKFIESAERFIPDIVNARHVGSMYTFRTVLPHKDATDERPTVVRKISENAVSVFSGKFSNCVEAADRVSDIVSRLYSV